MRIRTTLIGFALAAVTAATASANSITGASANFSTPYYTVVPSNQNQKGDETDGVIVTAFFNDGVAAGVSCTLSGGSCTSGSDFTLLITPATSATSSASWELYNLRTGSAGTTDDLLALRIEGIPGLTTFNPCLTGGLPDTSTGGCPGLTTGFGNSGSVSSDPGGIAGVTATVLYSNPQHLAGETAAADLWGTILLTFGGTTFEGQGPIGGTPFTFDTDTDQISSAILTVPEPTTYRLVGLALASFGFLKFRRRRKSEDTERDA